MGSEVARAAALVLFCLFLMLPLSHGANPNWDASMYAFLAMAVVLSAAFIGLAYMASQFFNAPALGAWVKIEVQELAISAIIVVMIVVMMASVDGASMAISGENAFSNAIGYLNDFVAQGQALHQKLMHAGYVVQVSAGFSYSGSISGGPIPISVNTARTPFGGMGGLAGAISNAVDSVSMMILFVSSQKVFLVFFNQVAAVIMPLGIVMRTFPLTRKLGALLLAGGVGTAVVYPAALVMVKEIYEGGNAQGKGYMSEMDAKIRDADKGMRDPGPPPLSSIICNKYVKLFTTGFGLGELFYSIIICTVSCAASILAGPLAFYGCFKSCEVPIDMWYYLTVSLLTAGMVLVAQGYANGIPYGQYFDNVYTYALPAATDYNVMGIVLSLIALIATIIAIRNLITLFGGESQLYGLVKLVG